MKLTKAFFEEVRKLILSARATVARAVDLVQVHTNFEIGPASLSRNRMARTEDRKRSIGKFGLQSHARTTWLALVR